MGKEVENLISENTELLATKYVPTIRTNHAYRRSYRI